MAHQERGSTVCKVKITTDRKSKSKRRGKRDSKKKIEKRNNKKRYARNADGPPFRAPQGFIIQVGEMCSVEKETRA